MSFLITSHGRTATKWLAKLLNKSKVFTVGHEPRGSRDNIEFESREMFTFRIPEAVQGLFEGNYGEVNSVMKYYFFDLKCDQKGIIWREPRDIILSFSNRSYKDGRLIQKIAEINYFEHRFIDFIADNECELIYFPAMVTDLEYCQSIIDQFVPDVRVTGMDLKHKTNRNPRYKYKHWHELPEDIKKYYDSLDWISP
jgi:hypothetical protein